jgi:1-acyl-sn-glycerol-3-phosphate acyltransferase
MTQILERCSRRDLPVVPMALSGLWGSFFSRKGGPAMTRPFRRAPFSRIGLRAGPPVPAPVATPEVMQRRVADLRGDDRSPE